MMTTNVIILVKRVSGGMHICKFVIQPERVSKVSEHLNGASEQKESSKANIAKGV